MSEARCSHNCAHLVTSPETIVQSNAGTEVLSLFFMHSVVEGTATELMDVSHGVLIPGAVRPRGLPTKNEE